MHLMQGKNLCEQTSFVFTAVAFKLFASAMINIIRMKLNHQYIKMMKSKYQDKKRKLNGGKLLLWV